RAIFSDQPRRRRKEFIAVSAMAKRAAADFRTGPRSPLVLAVALGLVLAAVLVPRAQAADRLRLAIQASGTFGWELAVARAHGLDKQADLELEATELASTEAGKIALIGGGADIILSD